MGFLNNVLCPYLKKVSMNIHRVQSIYSPSSHILKGFPYFDQLTLYLIRYPIKGESCVCKWHNLSLRNSNTLSKTSIKCPLEFFL